MKSGRLKFLQIGLMGLIVLAPLAFGGVYSWAAMAICAGILFLAFLYSPSILESNTLPKYFLGVSAFIFVWIFVQWIAITHYRNDTLQECLKWVSCFNLFLLIQLLNRRSSSKLAGVIVFVGVIEAIAGLLLLLTKSEFVLWQSKSFHRGFLTGTYLNRNHMGGLLELCLGLHLGFWLKAFLKKNVRAILFLSVLFIIVFLAFLKTGSRTALVSYGIAVFVMCFFFKYRSGKPVLFFISLLIVISLGILFMSREIVFLRLEELPEHIVSWEGRLVAWKDAMGLLKDHALAGIGLGNFKWFFPVYQSAILTYGWSHAHNDYLELAIELGIPAFILLMLFWSGYLISMIVRLKRVEESYFPLAWGGIVSIISLSLHGMTDFNFAIPANILIYVAVISIVQRLIEGHRDKTHDAQTVDGRQRIQGGQLKILGKIFVSVLALACCLICVRETWAGVWIYRGQVALRKGNYAKAFDLFQRIAEREVHNPKFAFDYGLSAWHLGRKTKRDLLTKRAKDSFERFIREAPENGRGWFYLAMARIDLESQYGSSKLSRDSWDSIVGLLDKAYRNESGSAWMGYVTGLQLIQHRGYLSAEEQKEAIRRIEKSVAIAPDLYLKPVLRFLWKEYSDFNLLQTVVPQNYESYRIFIDFIRKKNLWEKALSTYQRYEDLQKLAYQQKCVEGMRFLHQWNLKQAFKAFQKAFWIDPVPSQAKAGMLIAQEATGTLPDSYRTMLKQVLENEEDDISEYLNYLREVVYLVKDAYLIGIYQYRCGHFQQAIEWFEKTKQEGKCFRRYFAASLWKSGQHEKAIRRLMPVMDEKNPDLRDIQLMANWDSPLREAARAMIQTLALSSYPGKAWQGKGFHGGCIDHKGKIGLAVNLNPGIRQVKFTLRGKSGTQGEYGFIIIRVLERIVGMGYVNHEEPGLLEIQFETAGGKRWLEVELVNGSVGSEGKEGPVVWFDNTEIR